MALHLSRYSMLRIVSTFKRLAPETHALVDALPCLLDSMRLNTHYSNLLLVHRTEFCLAEETTRTGAPAEDLPKEETQLIPLIVPASKDRIESKNCTSTDRHGLIPLFTGMGPSTARFMVPNPHSNYNLPSSICIPFTLLHRYRQQEAPSIDKTLLST